MTKDTALSFAQIEANRYQTTLLVYCDPIGNAEDLSGPWGYCPPDRGADLLARFRDKALDMLVHPTQ